MFGSMFFVGKVVGMITLSHMGDSIGRIKLLRFSQTVTLLCYIAITCFINDAKLLTIPIFIAGLFSCWRTNLAYIYGQEIFSSQHKNLAGTVMLVNDVSTLLYSVFFFKSVSQEWTYLYYIVIAFMSLSVFILFQMPESPGFLLEKGMYQEAENAYNAIAKFNGQQSITVEIPENFSSDNITMATMADKPTLSEMLQDKKFRQKMFILIIFWIGSEFCFFVIGFYMKYLPGNTFDIVTL
jgi:MFS family permease